MVVVVLESHFSVQLKPKPSWTIEEGSGFYSFHDESFKVSYSVLISTKLFAIPFSCSLTLQICPFSPFHTERISPFILLFVFRLQIQYRVINIDCHRIWVTTLLLSNSTSGPIIVVATMAQILVKYTGQIIPGQKRTGITNCDKLHLQASSQEN